MGVTHVARSARDDLELSLNTGLSGLIDCGGPNLGEQVHQIRDRPGIELLHGLDEPAPEILTSESFAPPVELSTVRAHDMGLARSPS